MKILVTGASGTIGTRLCELLLQDGEDVIGVDRVPNAWLSNVDAITKQIDLLHSEEMEALPNDIDIIVHLAANARVYELVEHPGRALENMVTTFHVLEFARKHDIKKIIFSSSREVYGNRKADRYTEDMAHIEECESPYTASKIAGEALVEAYRRCYDIDNIILRFSNVYGMYDNSVRVVPLFFRQTRANEKLTVFGKEKCLDFTYIDDTVSGIRKAMEKFDDAKNEVYNIAFGEGTTIVRLAERMKELTGSTSDMNVQKSRRGEVTNYIANIEKAHKAFGYEPTVSFEEGIEKTVKWYKENTES
ncbi:nucleoside-diphosphate sugar epimerase [Candidatus Peregrinibacteria bacterium CG10_big_fil_rev_8_21_14_0_10_49_10]|nr:MAG: nucleoside-diphosphate sugar epimerase [Candidatus Peregrinibacteria bacterium CG10_big_fil_rev_8_21_14_0_10_49_10]